MRIYRLCWVVVLACMSFDAVSQTPCDSLGQNPATAFPVCGTDTFMQESVPLCGNRQILTKGCTDFLTDINPFWYRFTCFTAGTLGFKIIPKDLSEDYDWQLFDITNKNPADVYTDESLFVACNWSGEKGITGASADGTSLTVCGTTGTSGYRPLFSSMPDIIKDHEYLLLVSHFTNTQSGYSLSFGGANAGTANITDPAEPGLKSARAICDGIKLTVKLTKKMKCRSINKDGSDFVLTPALAPIVAAEGINCDIGFDMDSIVLTLANPIPPGNYQINIKNDINGINLLDNCDRGIPLGNFLPVTVFPLFPTPMDSLTKVGCAPGVLQLVFNKPMFCNSIAPDGSDFKLLGGGTPPIILKAEGICSGDGFTNTIQVTLSKSIEKKGIYRIELQVGTDGNTILNECSKETVVGSFIDFSVKDTVSADFSYGIKLGCRVDTINFTHDGQNEVNNWQWTFDDNIKSSAKDTAIQYKVFGTKKAILIVSNGVCKDTSAIVTIELDNYLVAAFESTVVVCPGDPATFTDKSTKHITAWNWTFGNGINSNLQVPQGQLYPQGNFTRDLPVRLIVKNNIGCFDTAVNTIRVVGNCYIAVPKAFTPNNDGLNDYLYPTNAYKARDLRFAIYNRGGQKIFETTDWTNKWDGTFKGNQQDPGTYVWTLVYTNIETGERLNLKGSTVLIR